MSSAATPPDVQIRDLTTIDQFRQVLDLERAIWGYTDHADMVGIPVFIFTVHRGAILIGAVEPDGRMVGFAYAVVGMKQGRPMLWSHMTGVLPDSRGGLGYRLKLEQRARALVRGYELIEWTFDPLQALNAHFNFAKLGCVSDEYAVNFYGESTSALHRGTPTDRLVASWHIGEPHVVRRLDQPAALRARAHDVADAPVANAAALDGQWRRVTNLDLGISDRRLWIEIPTGFTDMQQQAPERALEWRLQIRELFQTYFAQGYRAVDFVLQREAGFGRYLLARGPG
jgi:predicted GNAT superfamily acetyltransferase